MNPADPRALADYTAMSRRCAWQVITAYSSSFSLAARLLAPATRPHVAAIYALARVGDEIVDGAGAHAGPEAPARQLAEYRGRVAAALEEGFSTDPVVHAFGTTARQFGIGTELLDPFFESMAMDLDEELREHTPETLARYIHGSAEVIGEMCLRTFAGGALAADAQAAAGARALGAAFQKVNFLRDVREDSRELGRNYLPGRNPFLLTTGDVAELADEIDGDLAVAQGAVLRIPGRDRVAVAACHDIFAELNRRLRDAGPEQIMAGRVRVPDPVKARIVARAVAACAAGRWGHGGG